MGGQGEDWGTVLSLISELHSYTPESLSLESHLSKSAKSVLKGSHCCHTWVFKSWVLFHT